MIISPWIVQSPRRYIFSLLSLILIVFYHSSSFSQRGGESSFEYLNNNTNPKITSLGGINISTFSKNANIFISNPSLLADSLNTLISINYGRYTIGLFSTSLSLAKSFSKRGNWAISIDYLGYGLFERYDDKGDYIGDFGSRNIVLYIGNAHKIGNFAIGATIKYANNITDNRYESALLFDIGSSFIHPDKDLLFSLVFKNIGFPISRYSYFNSFIMPLDVQLGLSLKPTGMPFRFSFTLYRLHQLNSITSSHNNYPTISTRLFNHIVLGGELFIGKHINLTVGYNPLQRYDLSFQSTRSISGFSFGASINVKRINLEYGINFIHPSLPFSQFSISLLGGIKNYNRTKKIIP